MKKIAMMVAVLLTTACGGSSPGTTTPVTSAKMLGPKAGVSQAAGAVMTPMADTSWTPFVSGTRLQAVQQTLTGTDGSQIQVIVGYRDQALGNMRCAVKALVEGGPTRCYPVDVETVQLYGQFFTDPGCTDRFDVTEIVQVKFSGQEFVQIGAEVFGVAPVSVPSALYDAGGGAGCKLYNGDTSLWRRALVGAGPQDAQFVLFQ